MGAPVVPESGDAYVPFEPEGEVAAEGGNAGLASRSSLLR